MKKRCFLLLLIVIFVCCSCSIPRSYPKSGLYYCDQLEMTIDFSKSANEHGVKVILDNGQAAYYACQIDYGGSVFIRNIGTEELYLKGKFIFVNKIFHIKTDDETYKFVQIHE